MKTIYRLLFFLCLLAVPVTGLFAQPGGPGGPPPPPPPCWPPPCIPIDGGISLLIGAGALLGGRKAIQVRRSRKSEV
ncbi:MAG: hypothetical protein ABI373_05805 [Flavobacteriales bacterium]